MIAPGTVAHYSVKAEVGDFLRIIVDQPDADLVLRLTDPAGERIAELQDRGGDSRPLRIFYVTTRAGDYGLDLCWRIKTTKTGNYRIRIAEPHAADANDWRRARAWNHFEEANRIRIKGTSEAHHQALALLASARDDWRELGEKAEEAEALRDLCEIHAYLGEWPRMLEFAEAELALRREAGDVTGQGHSTNNLGYAHSALGQTAEALKYLNEALEIFRTQGSRRLEAIALSNIANTYKRSGNPYRALQIFEQLLPLRRQLGQKAGEAAALNGIGGALSSMAEEEESIPYLERAVSLFHEAGDKRGEETAVVNLAAVFRNLHQNPRAIQLLRQALEIARVIGERYVESTTQTELALAYLEAGEQESALKAGMASLTISRAIGDKRAEGNAMQALARAYFQAGEFGQAAEHARRAEEIFRSSGDPSGQYHALALLAEIDIKRGDLAAARKTLEDALSGGETVRASLGRPDLRASYFAALRRTYDLEIEVLMAMHAQHRPGRLDIAAFEQSEHARARGLLDWLAVPETRAIPFKTLQQVLDPDTLLLEFALGDQRGFGWAVTSRAISSFALPKSSELAAAAREAHLWLSSNGNKGAEAQLAWLSKALLGPLGTQLAKRRIAIVADGALQYVPFSALPVPGEHDRLLAADHEIVTLPSATTLLALRHEAATRKPASKLVAVVADPVFQRDDARIEWPAATGPSRLAEFDFRQDDVERSVRDVGLTALDRLPGTRREAEAILALAPRGETFHAFDFDATREVVLGPTLAAYRVVHLATHGIVNSRNPELSGLAFSMVDRQGNLRNGFVKASEVRQIKLSADLVVLSACQTALGKEVRGEGLVSLARAFMTGGTPRVLGTLWQVPDAATAEMMKSFYKSMLIDKLAPAAALRAAQLSIRQQARWASPYYWAGFVLIGEWR